MDNPLNQILDRMKKEPTAFIEVFAGCDKKKKKEIFNKVFDVNKTAANKIQEETEIFNTSSFGVFVNFNPLNLSRRLKANVSRINYIFIDLDDAVEEHNDLIKETLKKYGISFSYNAKSGHGFHILIPVSLSPDNELKVKSFLTYLKNNICDKVDVATYTNERLLRVPGSLHKKDDEDKELITLHCHTPDLKEIESNNNLFLKYQEEQKKGVKDATYLKSIKVQDVFFSEILNSKDKWLDYFEVLNASGDRNDNFIKNLGFFCATDSLNKELAITFLNKWEPARVAALEGWIKKGVQHNTPVLYGQLLKWAKENKNKIFIPLLIKQTSISFLDNYEIYYLEDEKKESSYLMYYPEKNYYVQKSFDEILKNIYFDSREEGVDLVQEFGLDSLDDWEDSPFKKQHATIMSCLHKKLDHENRIKLVFNINYEPIDSKFVYYNKKKFFNTYNKTVLWDYNKTEKNYGFPHIKELLMNLVGEKEEYYNYFNKWLGWLIKNPCVKLPTAIILQGRQGSGKGTFKNLILDNIFGENCQEINQTHLESAFNEYLLGKQIIVANEIMHNENRQTLPNILKNLVSDPQITISRKFRKEIVGQNFTHWIFCTNSDNPIKIDEDDRRYSVFYSEKLKGGGKAAANFVNKLKENLDYELKQYVSYLKSLDIKFQDVHEPIMTEAKDEIMKLNQDSTVRFLTYLSQFSDLNDCITTFQNRTFSYSFKVKDNEKYITTDLLYLCYEAYCDKFKERGLFNKQTFSKKISFNSLKNYSIYFPDVKKSIRSYELKEIEELMAK